MTGNWPIRGVVEDAFAPVRDAFVANFHSGAELGASFAVVIDGALVVDLVGGYTDRQKQIPWSEDTLACIYSSGKAVTALLVARAVSDGALDYDRRVADYWPAFGANGKDQITVAAALSHQAGLCGFRGPMAPEEWLDWDLICDRLAQMAPLWPPGSASGYHPQTAGFIAGELLRRATGRTVGEILREDFFSAHAIDVHCGFGAEIAARAAPMQKPPKPPDLGEINLYTQLAFLKPWSAPAKVGAAAWMAAELPASNMHANARALARLVHPFAVDSNGPGGAAIIDPGIVEKALQTQIAGDDLVLPFNLTWAAGIMANSVGQFGPGETSYGHPGFGGSCAMFDPPRQLSAAYVMNKMSPHLVGDPRATALLEATYQCL